MAPRFADSVVFESGKDAPPVSPAMGRGGTVMGAQMCRQASPAVPTVTLFQKFPGSLQTSYMSESNGGHTHASHAGCLGFDDEEMGPLSISPPIIVKLPGVPDCVRIN